MGWLYLRVRERERPRVIVPVYFLAAFIAVAALSAALSPRPLYSLGYFKKFWICSLLFVVPSAFHHRKEIERLYCWTALGATLSAGVGIFQYFFSEEISLVNRITGLTGHWMTFSGLQMLSLLALMPLLVSRPVSKYLWIYPAVPIQVFALALSQTRSAWFGFLAGLVVLALLISLRWLVPLILAIAGSWLVLPRHFQDRLMASFDFSDSTTRIRLELLRTGWNMIRSHPFFGVGPRRVSVDYGHYNTTNEFPSWIYQHLHNNLIQIAAELGLIALAVWICWLLVFAAHSIGQLRGASLRENTFAARASVCCIVALLVAGMFEYNFGDSEVLTLFLFIVTSPYVISSAEN